MEAQYESAGIAAHFLPRSTLAIVDRTTGYHPARGTAKKLFPAAQPVDIPAHRRTGAPGYRARSAQPSGAALQYRRRHAHDGRALSALLSAPGYFLRLHGFVYLDVPG